MALFVVYAPSGVGKTSLIEALLQQDSALHLSLSHTTRSRRRGEIDGQDYIFVSVDEFKHLIAQGAFLEHAKVYGNYYGTTSEQLKQNNQKGEDVLLEIDSQGARQVKQMFPDALLIAIIPPSKQEVHARLARRAKDSQVIITKRMASFCNELAQTVYADYVVINDNFAQALANLQAIVMAQRLRSSVMQKHIARLLTHSCDDNMHT